MKQLLLTLLTLGYLFSSAQKPTEADIEKALRSTWDRPMTSSSPKQSATIHAIKIGTGAKANEQDKIDGIPPNAMVTIAQIDFTVREFFNNATMATRRVMIAKVYKDQFDEWAVKSNGMKTTETKSEPKQ